MRHTSFADMQCSIGQALETIGQWWSPLIVRDIYLGIHRFDSLAEDLGISRNLLTNRLEHLLAAGVLERRRYQQRPARFEYHLTESGRELVPVLMALMAWGDRWRTPHNGPPVRLTHAECGEAFTPQVCCSACGERITGETVSASPGPGAAAGPGTRLLGSFAPAET